VTCEAPKPSVNRYRDAVNRMNYAQERLHKAERFRDEASGEEQEAQADHAVSYWRERLSSLIGELRILDEEIRTDMG
jgi:FtsZ-binding cell division protein ZapB